MAGIDPLTNHEPRAALKCDTGPLVRINLRTDTPLRLPFGGLRAEWLSS